MMKKLLMMVMFILTISLFSSVSVYAAQDIFKVDSATHINLVGKDRFAVDLQSNELIFANEPLSREYEEIWLEVRKGKGFNKSDTALKATYARGKGDSTRIDLKGLADGTYSLYIGYVFYGDAEAASNCENEDSTYFEDENSTGDGGLAEDSDYSEDGDYGEPENSAENENSAEDDNKLYALPSYDSYDFSIVVKGGKSSFKRPESYAANVKIVAKERTDEYVQDFYQNKGNLDYFKKTGILKQAKSIVSGITDDYEKVKAIQSWVYANIDYDWAAFYGTASLRYLSADDVLTGKITVCEGYANLTVALMQAAGFPAKKITGTANGVNGWGGHAWTEVYVDNRWVFMDSTWGDNYFDMPLIQYSIDHHRDDRGTFDEDNDIWEGELEFLDTSNFCEVLKSVPGFHVGDVVESTYGFNIKNLYLDAKCSKPFTLNTFKVDSGNFAIFVKTPKTCSIVYYLQADNAYKSLINYTSADAKEGSKLKAPKTPTKKGYTFVGWYEQDSGKKWNFKTGKVKDDTLLVAHFRKN